MLKVKKTDKYNRRYNYYNQKAKEFKILYLMYHHIIDKRKLNFIGKRNLLDHENISYTFKSKNLKAFIFKKIF